MKNTILKAVTWIPLGGLLLSTSARAGDCFTSELSHFVGNAAIASVTTVVVHKNYPNNKRPALTGFLVSATESFVGEAIGCAAGNNFSLLDAGVGVVGAACGAYATDKWYIAPRVNTQKKETTYGVMVSRKF